MTNDDGARRAKPQELLATNTMLATTETPITHVTRHRRRCTMARPATRPSRCAPRSPRPAAPPTSWCALLHSPSSSVPLLDTCASTVWSAAASREKVALRHPRVSWSRISVRHQHLSCLSCRTVRQRTCRFTMPQSGLRLGALAPQPMHVAVRLARSSRPPRQRARLTLFGLRKSSTAVPLPA